MCATSAFVTGMLFLFNRRLVDEVSLDAKRDHAIIRTLGLLSPITQTIPLRKVEQLHPALF